MRLVERYVYSPSFANVLYALLDDIGVETDEMTNKRNGIDLGDIGERSISTQRDVKYLLFRSRIPG